MRHVVHACFVVLAPVLVASAASGQTTPPAHHDKMKHDSAFAAMQERGKHVMGVDQYTSTHHFDALPDGGRIELVRDVDDSAGVAQIRAHLRAVARSFANGDFSAPEHVHMQTVPGTQVMAAKRSMIAYDVRDVSHGAELRIRTRDPDAVRAVHEFLAFQRHEHVGRDSGGRIQDSVP